jgi:hypothetical protein
MPKYIPEKHIISKFLDAAVLIALVCFCVGPWTTFLMFPRNLPVLPNTLIISIFPSLDSYWTRILLIAVDETVYLITGSIVYFTLLNIFYLLLPYFGKKHLLFYLS